MNIVEMRALVRADLHDEESGNLRWTDAEIDRHIARALNEFSEALPLEQVAALATAAGSRRISLSGLTGLVRVAAVEYPIEQSSGSEQTGRSRRFTLWGDTLTLLDGGLPDGSDCLIYFGRLHTLDAQGSSLPARYEDLVAAGACGYAAAAMAVDSINRINPGGTATPADWEEWSQRRLSFFRAELKRLGRRNRVRTGRLYLPGGGMTVGSIVRVQE